VRPGDIEGLAEGIEWARTHHDEIAARARAKAEQFPVERSGEAYASLYDEVLMRHRAKHDPRGNGHPDFPRISVVVPAYNMGDYLADALEIRDQLQVQIRRLSLGERMKMELIAALLHSPRVVFLDEPTIGLDLTAQRAIREFLLRYREERRPAMILTSHYMEDIERLCRRIIILREGVIVFDGLLDKVVADYADHKIITAHLRKQDESDFLAAADSDGLGSLGVVEQRTVDLVRLRVERARVAETAAELLRRLPVIDLAIEDADIGTVIERIQRSRQRSPEHSEDVSS